MDEDEEKTTDKQKAKKGRKKAKVSQEPKAALKDDFWIRNIKTLAIKVDGNGKKFCVKSVQA